MKVSRETRGRGKERERERESEKREREERYFKIMVSALFAGTFAFEYFIFSLFLIR